MRIQQSSKRWIPTVLARLTPSNMRLLFVIGLAVCGCALILTAASLYLTTTGIPGYQYVPARNGQSQPNMTTSQSEIVLKSDSTSILIEKGTQSKTTPVPPVPTLLDRYPFKWVILETDFCEISDDRDLLLVIVHSDPGHFLFRQSIRDTWGNTNQSWSMWDHGFRVQVLFATGGVPDQIIMKKIKAESTLHHDIIQQDFLSHYQNLTYTCLMWMKWVARYCPQATYILKVDDDTFVNRFAVLKLVRSFIERGVALERTFTCRCSVRAPVVRDEKDKWYVNPAQYKPNIYPLYCHGVAYLLSLDLPELLYEKSSQTDFLWVDDAYATGLLAEKVGGVKYQDLQDYVHLISDNNVKDVENYVENVLFAHLVSRPQRQYYWWDLFTRDIPVSGPTNGTEEVDSQVELYIRETNEY